jgi:hypothetical protein
MGRVRHARVSSEPGTPGHKTRDTVTSRFTLAHHDREVPQYCTGHFFERRGPSPSSSLVSDLPQCCTGHGLASASLLILWPACAHNS